MVRVFCFFRFSVVRFWKVALWLKWCIRSTIVIWCLKGSFHSDWYLKWVLVILSCGKGWTSMPSFIIFWRNCHTRSPKSNGSTRGKTNIAASQYLRPNWNDTRRGAISLKKVLSCLVAVIWAKKMGPAALFFIKMGSNMMTSSLGPGESPRSFAYWGGRHFVSWKCPKIHGICFLILSLFHIFFFIFMD